MKEKYINPFTDYGFKRLFGEEPSKDLLQDFLNELLREQEGNIVELSYLPNENLPIALGDRRAIFDIYCKNEKGERFIVEMQKAEQKYFKDRTVFYSTFPIQEQAKDKGKDWNFELKHVYTIGILDFVFKGDESPEDKYRFDAKICDLDSKDIFYDKLTYIYLAMPKFSKELAELDSKFEKWLYVIKNLNRLDRVPEKLREQVFLKFFETAEIARLDSKEYKEYQFSLNAYRDIKNSIDWAEEKGHMSGKQEGLIEGEKRGIIKGEKRGIIKGEKRGIIKGEKRGIIKVARSLLLSGMDIDFIANATELSIEEINRIKDEL